MQRIDELREPPVVGRLYLVPTIKYEWFGLRGVFPVIGPKHEDAEIIGFPYPHYHVDGRFLSRRQRTHAKNDPRGMAAVLAGRPIVGVFVNPYDHSKGTEALPPIVWRRRECTAKRVPYVTETNYNWRGGGGQWIEKLRAVYAGKSLAAGPCGRVCPHRGAPADSLAPDENGVITCPLHGLRFDAKTGIALSAGLKP